MEPSAPEVLRPWHRSRLRWINGLGFAISSALALIAVTGLLMSLVPGSKPLEFEFPAVYAIVTFLALLVTLWLFGLLMFRVALRGGSFGTYRNRMVIFFWSLAGALFFVTLSLIWLRFDSPRLPNLAVWATDFLWFLCPFGIATFGLMCWTNSDLPHRSDYETHGDDDHEFDDAAHAE